MNTNTFFLLQEIYATQNKMPRDAHGPYYAVANYIANYVIPNTTLFTIKSDSISTTTGSPINPIWGEIINVYELADIAGAVDKVTTTIRPDSLLYYILLDIKPVCTLARLTPEIISRYHYAP